MFYPVNDGFPLCKRSDCRQCHRLIGKICHFYMNAVQCSVFWSFYYDAIVFLFDTAAHFSQYIEESNVSLCTVRMHMHYLDTAFCQCRNSVKIAGCGHIRFYLITAFFTPIRLSRSHKITVFSGLLHMNTKFFHHLHGYVHIGSCIPCPRQMNLQSLVAHYSAEKKRTQKLAACINIQVHFPHPIFLSSADAEWKCIRFF